MWCRPPADIRSSFLLPSISISLASCIASVDKSLTTISSCSLLKLGVQNGLDPTTAAAIKPPDVPDSDSLPISGLTELARKLGYLAEPARGDWQSLQSIGF